MAITSKAVQEACQVLRSLVLFQHAGFTLDDSRMSSEADAEKIRHATNAYMRSWVIPIIDAIEAGRTRELPFLCEGHYREPMEATVEIELRAE